MRPQSCKSKGRRFQQQVRDQLTEAATNLEPDDIRSTSMGAGGEDLLLSPAARKVYPFSFECKNVEKLNIWKAIDQAKENAGSYTPAVAFTRNREDTYVVIPIEKFIELCHRSGNCCGVGMDSETK